MSGMRQAGVNYRHQLRKLFHGPVLGDIAAQVWVRQDDGSLTLYGRTVWKEWLKRRFIRGGSTEALSDEEFLVFIWRVESFAAMEMGVEFKERVVQ